MQNAFVCGVVAALSFIGFVCILFLLTLLLYRTNGNSAYVIKVPVNCDAGEIESLLYGAYFKKMIFGDLIFDDIEIDVSTVNPKDFEHIESLINEMNMQISIKPKENCEEKDERQP